MLKRINIGKFFIAFLFLCVINVQADSITDQIESLIAGGKLDQALSLTEKQLKGDDSNVNYLFLKGLILTRQNRMNDARDIFARLTDDHPELPEPYNNLAVIYAAQGDFTNARNALEQAINTHPSYATAHENLGDIYAKMASNAYNQALEIDGGNETAREKISMINELFSAKSTEQKTIDDSGEQLVNDRKKELNRLENELTDLLQKNEQQEKRAEDLQTELARLESQLELAAAQSHREIEAAEEQAAQARQRMVQVQEELAQLENRRATQIGMPADSAAAPMQPDTTDVEGIKQDIIRTVAQWAAFWSSKDVEGYLSTYTEDYSPSAGLSHREWMSQRRTRITIPRYIRVEINNPRVDIMGPDHARVDFLQHYQSDRYRDRVNKTLLLKLENGHWRIVEEKSG